jgi:uncharacterized protein (TIGR03435 family)
MKTNRRELFAGFALTALIVVFAGGPRSRSLAQELPSSFDVATIKPAGPFSLERMQSGRLHVLNVSGSRAEFQFVSLDDLLMYAYRVKPYQIDGPGWIRDGRWDIVAKIPEGASPDRVSELVKTLLVERFKLAAHRETRESPAYELVVDTGGPKLTPAPADKDAEAKEDAASRTTPAVALGGFPGAAGAMNFGNDGHGVITGGPNGTTRVSPAPSGGMRFEMARMTMPGLAEMLAPFVERPVINGTGLKGEYQITLDLSSEVMTRVIQGLGAGATFQGGFGGFSGGFGGFGGFPGGSAGGAGANSSGATADPGISSVFQAVQHLGLKLQPRKAPVETIVIDHLEKNPTDN